METGIRLLRAEEIECRVSTINEKGLSLLLYKDARTDQSILDEVFTPFGWQRSHQCIDGNLYCTVEIWDKEKQQWVGKTDVGTTSYTEKEKGQASDSFKRACFNWGIGRELYTAPFIWIPAGNVKIQKKEERYVTSERFRVKKIGYNKAREITELEIVNLKGETVFRMQSLPEEEMSGKARRKAFEKELERTGVSMEKVLERYQVQDFSQMTLPMYTHAMNSLKKTKPKTVA